MGSLGKSGRMMMELCRRENGQDEIQTRFWNRTREGWRRIEREMAKVSRLIFFYFA
jgi:hypothetical protein